MLRITLSAYVAVVLCITQWPTPPDPNGQGWLKGALDWLHGIGLPTAVDLGVVEPLANVAMFVPLGLLLPTATRLRPWLAIGVGAAFSTLIECSQLVFLPDRVASVLDVVMNTLGAAIGAVVVLAVRARGRTADDDPGDHPGESDHTGDR